MGMSCLMYLTTVILTNLFSGFTNSSFYTGDIEYQSLVSQGSYWLLDISEITVQGNSISLTGGTSNYAAIDTGTTLVGGPSAAIASIYDQIPNSQAGSGNYDGYYFYPCDTDVTVTMAYGGSTWTISSADFMLTQLSQSQCLGAFFVLDVQPGSSTPSWIVGDTFLKNVYSVFRYNPPSVGFASLSDYAKGLSGDLDAEVPTPTLGSVAAAITATGRSTRSSSSGAVRSRSTPQGLFAGLSVLAFAFVGGLTCVL
jgi:cathepsin D